MFRLRGTQRHEGAVGLVLALALLSAGCSGDDTEGERTALARVTNAGQPGSQLHVSIANGPQSCSIFFGHVSEGPGCDSPSWLVQVSLPPGVMSGTVSLDTPGLVTVMGQIDDCHEGEPVVDDGALTITGVQSSGLSLELVATTQSSVDPSGQYLAPLCP